MTDRAARKAWRIAIGVAITFAACELYGLTLAFLPAVITASQLEARDAPPSCKQAIGIVVAIAGTGGVVMALSAWLIDSPAAYIPILVLLLFLGFLLDTAGKPAPAALILLMTCAIPVIAVHSLAAAGALLLTLIHGAVVAVVVTWLMFAALPPVGDAAPKPAPAASVPRPSRALVHTLILLPVVLVFLSSQDMMSCVELIVISTMLRQREQATTPRLMLGLLIGNLLGGLLAVVGYGALSLLHDPVFLFLVLLLVGLLLGRWIAVGGPAGQVCSLALMTFLILFGLGISPLPTDSGDAFIDRLISVLGASAYVVVAVMMIRPWEARRAGGGDVSPSPALPG